MDKRTKWILFMAVVLAFSILWPLSHTLRKAPSTNETQAPQGPVTITPVEDYVAEVNATVKELKPVLYGVGYADSGSVEDLKAKISSWDGVVSVNITRSDSPDPNYLYRFDFVVNVSNSSLDEKIGFWMNKLLPVSMKSVFVPVELDLPENATFHESKTGVMKILDIPSDVKSFGYYYIKPGKTQARIYLTLSGGKVKTALAIAGSPIYFPPMQNVFTSVTGEIRELTKAVVLASVDWGIELNDTQLSKEWNATVRFFPAQNEIICPGNASVPEGFNKTVSGDEIIIHFNNSQKPNVLLAELPTTCHLDTGVLRVEGDPARLEELKTEVSKVANVTDAYYLAKVEIPKEIELGGVEKEVPSTLIENVKTYQKEGNVTFLAKVTEAYGVILGISYGELY